LNPKCYDFGLMPLLFPFFVGLGLEEGSSTYTSDKEQDCDLEVVVKCPVEKLRWPWKVVSISKRVGIWS